ncbi:cytidylyltransferase domain-containing protein [Paenibacillus andongensis]|uniref:cytidylyltransferase domain-containing protein n=1 Tax=Paenibacillus andongensis TaxID=2975482 RepID=UPI00346315F4
MLFIKFVTIIQARMGSERLPGKVLLPLGDSCVLDYVISRSKHFLSDEVVVATTENPLDDILTEWCKDYQIPYFRGSEQDVLSRFYDCAKQYDADYVIRVTSDCPFVDFKQARKGMDTLRNNPVDFVVFPEDQPRGLTVEIVSFEALAYFHTKGHEARHREHVTYYGYEFIEEFKTVSCDIPLKMKESNLRITLDTEDDYELCKKLADVYPDKLIDCEHIVDFLVKHPEVASINSHIIQKPVI